jgi:threonine dehydratase
VSVSVAAVREAMALAARLLMLVLEPSGAAALAAELRQPPTDRKCVAVVLSGGNVDSETLAGALEARIDE